MGHIPCFPIVATIVGSEEEIHSVLVGQLQELLNQINRGNKTLLFLNLIFRWIGQKFLISGTDKDHSVDSHFLHVLEILVPFLPTPVLMGNVMTDFIQKRSTDD